MDSILEIGKNNLSQTLEADDYMRERLNPRPSGSFYLHLADLREVDVADLLGRDPVPPKDGLFDACIRERVVMVTGAGGSIGSELCRQIVGLRPRRLVLFEMSELALYNIEREVRALAEKDAIQVELVGLIGNAHDRSRRAACRRRS